MSNLQSDRGMGADVTQSRLGSLADAISTQNIDSNRTNFSMATSGNISYNSR